MKHIPLIGVLLLMFSLVCAAEVPNKEISREQVLSASQEWKENYDGFQPKSEQIDALKSKLGNDLKIEIYLGLWCPDSRRNVPPFLKILDEIKTPIPVRFVSVQKKPTQQIRYYVDNVRVERVPTFIFRRGEKEIGRIVENPRVGLVEDMIAILSK